MTRAEVIPMGGPLPVRKHESDAGADAILPRDVAIWPHDTAVVGLGFGLRLPPGWCAVAIERSSLAKEGLLSHMSPIDPGYEGEAHLILTNLTGSKKILRAGSRVAQLVVLPFLPIGEAESAEPRGDGAFGSTGG